jgi:hypothetical protein
MRCDYIVVLCLLTFSIHAGKFEDTAQCVFFQVNLYIIDVGTRGPYLFFLIYSYYSFIVFIFRCLLSLH